MYANLIVDFHEGHAGFKLRVRPTRSYATTRIYAGKSGLVKWNMKWANLFSYCENKWDRLRGIIPSIWLFETSSKRVRETTPRKFGKITVGNSCAYDCHRHKGSIYSTSELARTSLFVCIRAAYNWICFATASLSIRENRGVKTLQNTAHSKMAELKPCDTLHIRYAGLSKAW